MDSIFESDPKITITFEHCFIETSLTLRVLAKEYPMLNPLGRESTEQMRDVFCGAIALSVSEISNKVLEAHSLFGESVGRAQVALHGPQLKSSLSTT